jgi:hypothetical protein
MLFHVLRQRREGRVIPRHTLHIDAERVQGELRVCDGRDPLLRRSCRVARLVDPAGLVADVLPPLKAGPDGFRAGPGARLCANVDAGRTRCTRCIRSAVRTAGDSIAAQRV